ncbi:MAG: ribosome small subunit-dependent GTPase A [Actinobacteria bacterium]|nr:ribosome small subunit-dependent GTPase A [Actinomycetota bacterium]
MDKRQRRRLRDLLAGLDVGERNRLTKRAAKLHKAALRTMTGDARRPELQDFLLRLLDEQEKAAAGFAAAPSVAAPTAGMDGSRRGTVVAVTAGACVAQAGDDALDAVLPADLTRRQQSGLAVGDEVLLEPFGEGHRVTAVLPRRSLLTRADPHDARRSRAIAANVDIVVVVVAAKAPPLHPRLIDRYLVAVERSGARAALVVNKADLLDDDERRDVLALLQPYRGLGLPVLLCSVTDGEGIEGLRDVLHGATCVFVGQSGVGKSSLLNALHATAAARTGAVRAGDGRGRHTTSSSSLYELPGDIRVIDTPGIRRFSVDDADAVTLADGFTEFAPYAARCRYRDCAHTHEPGCAVKAAVDDGAISRRRYASYRKLVDGDDDPQQSAGAETTV